MVRALFWVISTLVLLFLWSCSARERVDTGAEAGSDSSAAVETEAVATIDPLEPYRKPGFVVELEDGRLWVLRPGQEKTEKHVTLVGAGPGGITLKGVDRATLKAYLSH